MSRAELASAAARSLSGGDGIIGRHVDQFRWDWYGTPERRHDLRRTATDRFLADLDRRPARYVAGSLPDLPFADRSYDLVLCSHLLFTWAGVLDADWHLAAGAVHVPARRRLHAGRASRSAAVGQTGPVSDPTGDLQERVLDWYDRHARDLPWRRPDAGPWAVLVSEIMLQQTPVARVLPAYTAWLERWPTPAALAADSVGAAVRAWGRLGYPRRAVRLHQAATAITERNAGVVPSDLDTLRALPGIGDYTAAAVAVFAYQRRHPVLDTNVRRVFARTLDGAALPGPSVRVAEREAARRLLPPDPTVSARWSVAVMELGALVCTARSPRCDDCPIADRCTWRLGGYPAYDGPPRPTQSYDGTDRQCRGALLAVLRDAAGPVHRAELEAAWDRAPQRERALDGLVADGLVAPLADDRFGLP